MDYRNSSLRRRHVERKWALSPEEAAIARGHHRQTDYADALGGNRTTVQRMEMEEGGATLTQALAMAGEALGRGDLRIASWIVDCAYATDYDHKNPTLPGWAPADGRVR